MTNSENDALEIAIAQRNRYRLALEQMEIQRDVALYEVERLRTLALLQNDKWCTKAQAETQRWLAECQSLRNRLTAAEVELCYRRRGLEPPSAALVEPPATAALPPPSQREWRLFALALGEGALRAAWHALLAWPGEACAEAWAIVERWELTLSDPERRLLTAAAKMEGEFHGYQLVHTEAKASGLPEIAFGTSYRALEGLERRGYLVSRLEDEAVALAKRRPRRRYYTATEKGREAANA